MVCGRSGSRSGYFKSLVVKRALREQESPVKRRIKELADPEIIPLLSISLGDVKVGPTTGGGFALNVSTTGETSGLRAGVELRPNEPPRWGVLWEWRF